jgi:hypothetical protein
MTKPQKKNGGHVYQFGGSHFPSVTTILSRTSSPEDNAYLEQWRKTYNDPNFKNAEDYTNYTSIRGTLVHYNVLNETTGVVLDPSGLPPLSEWWDRRTSLIKEIDKSVKLWKDLSLPIRRPITAETAIFHPQKRYAGTPDLIANVGGEMVVLDLKTSSGIRDKHLLQIGAYSQIVNHHHPNTIKRGILVYLHPKFHKAIVCEVEGRDLKDQIEMFNDCLHQFWKIPGVKKEYGLL